MSRRAKARAARAAEPDTAPGSGHFGPISLPIHSHSGPAMLCAACRPQQAAQPIMIGPFARRETAAMRRRAERQIDVFIVPIRASGAGMWLRVPLGYQMIRIEQFLELQVLDEYNGRWPPHSAPHL